MGEGLHSGQWHCVILPGNPLELRKVPCTVSTQTSRILLPQGGTILRCCSKGPIYRLAQNLSIKFTCSISYPPPAPSFYLSRSSPLLPPSFPFYPFFLLHPHLSHEQRWPLYAQCSLRTRHRPLLNDSALLHKNSLKASLTFRNS